MQKFKVQNRAKITSRLSEISSTEQIIKFTLIKLFIIQLSFHRKKFTVTELFMTKFFVSQRNYSSRKYSSQSISDSPVLPDIVIFFSLPHDEQTSTLRTKRIFHRNQFFAMKFSLSMTARRFRLRPWRKVNKMCYANCSHSKGRRRKKSIFANVTEKRRKSMKICLQKNTTKFYVEATTQFMIMI